jgi:hypothetical protein
MKNLLVLSLLTLLAVKIHAQNVDLTTTNFVATVTNEKKITFTYSLKNTGTSSIQGYGLKLIFSADNMLDFNDQFFITIPFQDIPAQAIGAGQTLSKSGQYDATSPGGYMPIGTWHIFAEVNYSREVTETNYINNITLGNEITVNNYVINFSSPPTITSITSNSVVINTPSELDMTQIYYLVQLNGVAAPSETIMKNADRIFPWIHETNVTNLGPGVDYDVYFMGEYYDGKVTSIYKIDVKTTGGSVPTLVASKTNINFNAIDKDSESTSITYALKGFYLTSDVAVSTLGNFLLSKDNSAYSDKLTFTASEFSGGVEKTIYVKFIPGGTAGSATGDIVHAATGAQNELISLSGIAYDPSNHSFDGLSDLSETGWTGISISGYQAWELLDRDNTTMGRPSSDDKMLRMDGSLNGETENEDWLISPRIDLSVFDFTPTLSFASYTAKNGAPLQLKYSTNYIGEGSPSDATWVDLDAAFPAQDSKTWTTVPDLELPKLNNLYVAFVYTSTDQAAARWLIDNFFVYDRLLSIPQVNLDFQNVMVGTASAAKSFIVQIAGHGNVTVEVSAGYQVSLDNINFASSVVIPEDQASTGQTVYVRFTPTGVVENFAGTVSFSGVGLAVSKNNLIGSTSITTAIGSPFESKQSIYPNPTRGTVYVNSGRIIKNTTLASVRIFTAQGLEIGKFQSGAVELDGNLTEVMERAHPGVYVIEIRSGDVMVREKIIKE